MAVLVIWLWWFVVIVAIIVVVCSGVCLWLLW